MATDLDALLREIASRHGLAVGRDDPILVVHTLHSVLLRDMASEQQRLLDEFLHRVDEATQRTIQDSGDRVERVIRDALGTQRDALTQALTDAGEAAARRFEHAVRDHLGDVQRQHGRTRQGLWLALLGTAVAWAAALATVALALTRH